MSDHIPSFQFHKSTVNRFVFIFAKQIPQEKYDVFDFQFQIDSVSFTCLQVYTPHSNHEASERNVVCVSGEKRQSVCARACVYVSTMA